MPGHSVYLVDVFSEPRYAGNPFVVVVCQYPLGDCHMQRFAAECAGNR